MKSILKSTILIVSINAAMFLASCGNETKKETMETEHHEHSDSTAHAYICPMNCENGKTYTEPGKCPKCGMDLEHNDNTGNHEEHKH